MILINIDSLSTTELQYIAQQEGLATWQSLDREELIDALEEAFEDQDDEIPAVLKGKINRNRYCNSLTDYRGTLQHINGLPGVEELPESYVVARPPMGVRLLVALPVGPAHGVR